MRRSLKAFPATPTTSIETTCSHLVLDEWAHTFDPEAVWQAVEPTLSPRATSGLITTARDPDDFVHRYYLKSEAGLTRHAAVFISVLERPDRSVEWVEQKRLEEGKWQSLRNYPLTAEEAFAAANEPYFAAELVEAAQVDAIDLSVVRRGDRCVKAWDIGRKHPSVCVVLRAPSQDEAQIFHVVAYKRLVEEEYPVIQREIERTHRQYPGPTVVEANSIGKAVIENLRLPEDELIEHTTTKASKQQMLTAIELHLQQRSLKIHSRFRELLDELTDYRQPEGSIPQDSVMALGFAVANAGYAHARWSGREASSISSRTQTPGTTGTTPAVSDLRKTCSTTTTPAVASCRPPSVALARACRNAQSSSHRGMTIDFLHHCLGAAGAVEAAFTVLTVNRDIVPPTINYQTPEPACDLDCVPNGARELPVRVALSNSFGFGGHNAVLIMRKFVDGPEPRRPDVRLSAI